MADRAAHADADWILKAMVAVAAADGRLDTQEVGLIQQVYKDQSGRTLTADEVARAAEANAKGDVLAEFAAAAKVLDKATKEEMIRAAYLVLLADARIAGEERKKLKDIAAALQVSEIHFGAILEDLAKIEGFELRTFAVPAPGLEMGAQVLDITGRYKPDFVITHLFGRAPSVSIKELKGKGFPLSKVVAFVWGSAEADVIAAGGMGMAEGYNTIQFAGVGKDFPVLKEIEAMYKAQGKAAPKEMDSTVYYNRGVLNAALHVEAVRNAIKAKGGAAPTPEEVKKGMEAIKGFTLGGLVPPMELTPADHEGGGWVQIWTVKGGKLVKVKDWFQGYRPVIEKHLAAEASKS